MVLLELLAIGVLGGVIKRPAVALVAVPLIKTIGDTVSTLNIGSVGRFLK